MLVVDDEQGIQESLGRIFAREGFQVLTASDAKAGLELLRRQPVKVLLTDLVMPGMTGTDLLKAAKAIAPAEGRITVWMTSLTWLMAGELSAKNSTIHRITSKPMIHQDVRPSHGCLR